MTEQRKGSCVVLGAGIVGSAVAYELCRRGLSDLHVLDVDLEGEYSSTERNAGGVRHLWQHPINVELSRHSIALFETLRREIGFQQSGYLWLFKKEEEAQADALLAHTKKMGVPYEQLDPSAIQRRYPFMDKMEDVSCGLFGRKDGILNSNALKLYFREHATANGARFHDRTRTLGIERANGCIKISVEVFPEQKEAQQYLLNPSQSPRFPQETWTAEVVVLCLGAWSQCLKLQEAAMHLKPIRRQISVFSVEGFDMSPYGMVVDTSRVYFHPEGGNVLAGFVVKEEQPGFNFHYDPDFFETYIWPPLFERSSRFERLKHITGWGGLYHYTPDTTGILGKVPGWDALFEAHSFTGHGVMQSYGAAVALADLILEKQFKHFDASGLNRSRFSDPKRTLPETLHI